MENQCVEQLTEPVKEIAKTCAVKNTTIDYHKSNINSSKEQKETKELIAKGAMKTSVYLNYIKSGGQSLAFLVTLMNCVFVTATCTFNFRLATWTKNDDNRTMPFEDNNFGQSDFSVVEKLWFSFGNLVMLMIIASFLSNLFYRRFILNVSKNIHNLIFSRLLTAPMRFFEGNSTGQILNRFSEDTGVIDNPLPITLFHTINVIFIILKCFLSAVLVNPYLSIPCIISLLIPLFIGKLCIPRMQKIKRLTGIAKSPMLSFAASSLEGVTTIRSCRVEHIVTKDFDTRQDLSTASQLLIIALGEAFSFWIQLFYVGLLASVTFACVFLNDRIQAGSVGLSLMQMYIVTGMIAGLTKWMGDVFSYMTSVERMLQFTELEQETIIEDEPALEVPKLWPDKGQITFKNLYLRYFEDSDPVLWNINCLIKAGSKVGIVGRSGAGKTSLTSALFRILKTDGNIIIDGIDINRVDLYKLRSKLSIIPQDPVLFEGSLRTNLDPLNKFEDAILWSALEKIELKRFFNSLDFPIERSGSNLSASQRQLVCLARAIVNNNKIVILDEATANIDSETDALIQKAIRSIFKECTVLTIAHRLETVMDNDKVLVVDNGRLVEYDHPYLLLQNKNGYLFKMLEQMGQTMFQNLEDLSGQAYKSRVTS